ncbi:hypothetical protein KY284_015318 [Solanum tuberosum]|nr:hypothetical protein KY284_015318 [Solanum tuberosum]
MAELEKEIEAALSKITHLEREGEAAVRKIVAVKKKKQAALIKIYKLEKEKERTVNKVALLEKEGKAALCNIAMLETEKQDTSSKIEQLEEEKEDAAKKIAFLEMELETKEEKFGKYVTAQLQKEEELRTKFEDFKKHTNAECKIEKDAAMSKIVMLETEQQAASSKIEELEKEKEDAAKKIAFLEKELDTKEETFGKYMNAQLQKKELRTKFEDFKRHTNVERKIEKDAAMRKIAMLESEQQAASSKIEELEKEKEDTAKKITFLEKEQETKEEKTEKYMNAQLQKEEELRTKFEDYKRHTNAEHKIEKDAAINKIAMLEKVLETKEVRAYKQAIRALREIQVEDEEAKEKVKELTITMQKLTEERHYWETLAKKDKELETAELVESQKEMTRVLTVLYSSIPGKTSKLWNIKQDRKATLSEAIGFLGKKLEESKIKDTGFVKVNQLKPGTEDINLIVKVLNTNVVVNKNQNTRQQFEPRITRVAESLVGDETGNIIFTARNEQVDLMEPGSILLLYGAKIQMYRGSMRVAVEHRAQIIIAEPEEFVVKEDCNMSLIKYELVNTPIEE